MINGNDGGAYVSTDAGKSWRYLDNLPIEQFYMVAFDDNRPYLLCGGLQDNNGWCGPSNSLSRGGIVGADWWTATGGDGEYIVPAGNKSNIIYADSQNGSISRMDADDRHGGFRAAVPARRHRPGAQGPEIPVQLDVADRGGAERLEDRLSRRQRAVQIHRRRQDLDADQPRPDAQRQVQATAQRRAGGTGHERRGDVRRDPVHGAVGERSQRDLGRAPTTAWCR